MELVTTQEIADLLKIKPDRVRALEKSDASFPRAIRVTKRTLRWDMSEIESWINRNREQEDGKKTT